MNDITLSKNLISQACKLERLATQLNRLEQDKEVFVVDLEMYNHAKEQLKEDITSCKIAITNLVKSL